MNDYILIPIVPELRQLKATHREMRRCRTES